MYESIENGCTEQQYQTFASESEQLCKKKTRRRKQNQQAERFFNLFEENFTRKCFIGRRRSVLNLCYVAFPEDDHLMHSRQLVNRNMVPLQEVKM